MNTAVNMQLLKELANIRIYNPNHPSFVVIDGVTYLINGESQGWMNLSQGPGVPNIRAQTDIVKYYWNEMMESVDYKQRFQYSRHSGYECSSKGDKRFSAFNAMLPDGRTIEVYHQTENKGYPGNDWRIGKGKPPVNGKTRDQLWSDYYAAWQQWCDDRPIWVNELRYLAAQCDYTIRDSFASGVINQARALAQYLNDHPWDGHHA